MTTRRTFFLQVLGVICAPMLPKSMAAAAARLLEADAPHRVISLGRIDVSKCHFTLSGRGLIELAEKAEAEREARRMALGVPRGFEIPEEPIPATKAEREAELAITTELMDAAFEASLALPPGPERRSQAAAMVAYSSHRTRLMLALRDGEIGT